MVVNIQTKYIQELGLHIYYVSTSYSLSVMVLSNHGSKSCFR